MSCVTAGCAPPVTPCAPDGSTPSTWAGGCTARSRTEMTTARAESAEYEYVSSC